MCGEMDRWSRTWPSQGKTEVNHRPGREVIAAHPVRINPGSRLADLAGGTGEVQVNSSHHQALRVPGDNLRVTASVRRDGVIEAMELDSPNHFVVGVQWHPERTVLASPLLPRDFFRIYPGRGSVAAASRGAHRTLRA